MGLEAQLIQAQDDNRRLRGTIDVLKMQVNDYSPIIEESKAALQDASDVLAADDKRAVLLAILRIQTLQDNHNRIHTEPS